MAKVRLDGAGKTYANGVNAVTDVSFETGDGELLVLVGPSGCGKSTTLRMIAGLESITSGDIYIGDRRVNDVAPRERDIAMVFQNYALYPHMTVHANLAFGLKLRKLPRPEIELRVRAAAETLDITGVLDRRPAELSGGQRQRVAVGRAIVRDPAVFLFDEPLSNLDAKLRAQTRKEIARLHRDLAATMIYVTHDQVEAMTLGDRIVVMDGGIVQQIDSPSALYDRPANRFVAGFMGNPSMNLVEGTVVSEDGVWFCSTGPGIRLRLEAAAGQRPGTAVTLGFRPEHVTFCGVPDSAAATAAMVVDVVEPLGNEAIVYGRCGGDEIAVRLSPPEMPAPGSTVGIRIDASRSHLFEARSGERIGGVGPMG
jgi:multiple sugar transport system ATP-binding protein